MRPDIARDRHLSRPGSMARLLCDDLAIARIDGDRRAPRSTRDRAAVDRELEIARQRIRLLDREAMDARSERLRARACRCLERFRIANGRDAREARRFEKLRPRRSRPPLGLVAGGKIQERADLRIELLTSLELRAGCVDLAAFEERATFAEERLGERDILRG